MPAQPRPLRAARPAPPRPALTPARPLSSLAPSPPLSRPRAAYKRQDYLKRLAIQNNFVATTSNLGPGFVPYVSAGGHPPGPCVRGDPDWVNTNPPLGQSGNGPSNYWCGSGVTDKMNGQVDDAYGLMVVSALLGGVAWVLVTMVMQGSTALVGRQYAYEGVVGTMLASAFFALCSISVFDASGLKKSFCSVFDPDANTGVYCGYYDGFFAVRAWGAQPRPHSLLSSPPPLSLTHSLFVFHLRFSSRPLRPWSVCSLRRGCFGSGCRTTRRARAPATPLPTWAPSLRAGSQSLAALPLPQRPLAPLAPRRPATRALAARPLHCKSAELRALLAWSHPLTPPCFKKI